MHASMPHSALPTPGAPNYPVLYDAEDRVLSLPPIINGEHSRLSPETKNVFIECTCTDLTKGHQVLNLSLIHISEPTRR